MVNMKKLVDEELWNSIEKNYLNQNYTGAINDAVFYIRDIIREKSNIDVVDGRDLINLAFGGKTPKIKINKLLTKTETSIQSGLHNSLLGIWGYIRNPRSHDKYEDNQEDAVAIILYINYLAKIIGKAKSSFSVEKFIESVYDEHFDQTEKYAKLLVNEIPNKQIEEVVFTLYQSINKYIYIYNENKNDNKAYYKLKDNHRKLKSLKLVFLELMKKFGNEKEEIIKKISNDLSRLSINNEFYWKVYLLVNEWQLLNEIIQIRVRKMLTKYTDDYDYAYYKNQIFLEGWKYFDIETREIFYNKFMKNNKDYIVKNDNLKYIGSDITLEKVILKIDIDDEMPF